MTTTVDPATTLVHTANSARKTQLREAPITANFSQHLIPVAEDARPAIYATLIDHRGADFLLKENERAAQYNAMQEFAQKSSAIGEQIGDALFRVRQLFADMGVPIVDMVEIGRSPDGTFHVKGWGKGESVSHPQAKFIEAILNGKAPGFEKMSEKVTDLMDKVENLFAQSQDLREHYAPLVGASLGGDGQRKDSIFDGHFMMGAEHTGRIKGEARELSRRDPADFQAFKDSLGGELDKLSYDQVLSRYHFDTVLLPKLRQTLPDFFS